MSLITDYVYLPSVCVGHTESSQRGSHLGCVLWVRPLCKEHFVVTAGHKSATEPGSTRAPLDAANENNTGAEINTVEVLLSICL